MVAVPTISMDQDNIWVAASDGRIEDVEHFLLNMSPDSQDDQGYSVLAAAVSWGHAELVELLLGKYKANIDILDQDGDSSLFLCSDAAMAQLLVGAGIDVSVRNHMQRLAIEAHYIEGHDDIVAVLEPLSPEWQKLEEEREENQSDGLDYGKLEYLLSECEQAQLQDILDGTTVPDDDTE
jgi:ankyrin repeat protein